MTGRTDRIAGSLIGLAVGDALGAGYEFGPPVDGPIGMIGGGPFNWDPGEWTDDTQMAICIAENSAPGSIDLVATGDRFIEWSNQCNDIGIQTRAVLSCARSGEDVPVQAKLHHERRPHRSAGNGSLMRTGPVPLPFLGDVDAIEQMSMEVSSLTHYDRQCGEACILWSIAIDAAIDTGEVPDIRLGLDHLPERRQGKWEAIIDEAEQSPPGVFTPNGYVVSAFQAAWSSIVHTEPGPNHYEEAVIQAIRIGHDTDTVAAITGTLMGAAYGTSAIPDEWVEAVHGWPGLDANDLITLALEASGEAP